MPSSRCLPWQHDQPGLAGDRQGYAGEPTPSGGTQSRPGRYALNIGFLNNGGQCLLRQAARLEKTGEIRAFTQLGDPQLDGASACLPIPVAIAVTLYETFGILLAISSACQAAYFQFHQPLRGKADHVAQKIAVRTLPNQGVQVHLVSGHRWSP